MAQPIKGGRHMPITRPAARRMDSSDPLMPLEEVPMSKTPRRALDEVQAVLADLAHRVVVDPGSSLDLDLRDRLLDITDELELFIPGLDAPAYPSAARQLT